MEIYITGDLQRFQPGIFCEQERLKLEIVVTEEWVEQLEEIQESGRHIGQ